jgi:hypothetical protein
MWTHFDNVAPAPLFHTAQKENYEADSICRAVAQIAALAGKNAVRQLRHSSKEAEEAVVQNIRAKFCRLESVPCLVMLGKEETNLFIIRQTSIVLSRDTSKDIKRELKFFDTLCLFSKKLVFSLFPQK